MTRVHGGYVLDRAAPADLDAILRLEGLGDSTRHLLSLDLLRDDRWCLVARRDAARDDARADAVVGMAIIAMAADEAHLLDLAVDQDHRRRGIGTALVTAVRDLARQLGARAMTLEVRESNAAARALYRRLGFADAGTRPGYYPDGGPDGGRETAVVMWDGPAG